MKILWVIVAVGLWGCFSSGTAAVKAAHANDVNRIHQLALSKMIMSFCNGAKEPSSPSEHIVRRDGVAVTQPCGMVAMEVLTKLAIAEFIEKVCGGTDSEQCGQSMWEMFVARLQERYAFANWDKVVMKCKAHLIECKQWMYVEFWATESHNDGVLEWARQAYNESSTRFQAAYEQAYREEVDRRRRFGAALQAIGTAMAPTPTIHCTSNSYGTTTNTECH